MNTVRMTEQKLQKWHSIFLTRMCIFVCILQRLVVQGISKTQTCSPTPAVLQGKVLLSTPQALSPALYTVKCQGRYIQHDILGCYASMSSKHTSSVYTLLMFIFPGNFYTVMALSLHILL